MQFIGRIKLNRKTASADNGPSYILGTPGSYVLAETPITFVALRANHELRCATHDILTSFLSTGRSLEVDGVVHKNKFDIEQIHPGAASQAIDGRECGKPLKETWLRVTIEFNLCFRALNPFRERDSSTNGVDLFL